MAGSAIAFTLWINTQYRQSSRQLHLAISLTLLQIAQQMNLTESRYPVRLAKDGKGLLQKNSIAKFEQSLRV
jgi:hypothetical protein